MEQVLATSKNNGESLIINQFYSKFQSSDQQCLIVLFIIDFARVINTEQAPDFEATCMQGFISKAILSIVYRETCTMKTDEIVAKLVGHLRLCVMIVDLDFCDWVKPDCMVGRA